VEIAAMNFESSDLPDRLNVLNDSLLAPTHESFQDGDVLVHAITPTTTDRLRMLPVAIRAVPLLRRKYHTLKALGYPWYRSVYKPKLKRLMEGFDVVHSVAREYLGWTAQEAAQELGIPFVNTPYVHPGQQGDDEQNIAFYRKCDAVLALLETDRRFLSEIGVPDEKIHVSGVTPLLPPTTDPESFRERHDLGEKPVVLFVGRMQDYKGYPTIVDAAPQVWEHLPDTHFLFAGSGPDGLEDDFDEMDPRLQYLGRVSEQEKADALATCTLFCMPSEYEILPAVYLEAWSYGKPVLGGKAHGLPELVEGNDAGVTVEQDPEQLASTLIDLLQSPDDCKRMGQNGQALVQRRYSKEALVDRLVSVYENVTAQPTATAPQQ